MELEENGSHAIFDKSDKKIDQLGSESRGESEHIANFLNAIRDNKPLELNAVVHEAHKSTLLCHLGNIAQRTGHTLNCDRENGRIANDQQAMGFWSREYDSAFELKV